MAVTVVSRTIFSSTTPTVYVHPLGVTTLVDGRGNLLVLDAEDINLSDDLDDPRTIVGELIKHTVAVYADGEWSHAQRGELQA